MSKKKFDINELLNSASKGANTMESGQDIPRRSSLKIISLSVHDLIPSADNFYSVKDIAELKVAIELLGVKQNLTVKPLRDGKYQIIAGHRRHKACMELVSEGKKEFEYVPCAVETEKDEIIERIILIMTNSTARITSDWEKMKQSEELRTYCEAWKKRDNLPGRVRDMVAQIMNESATQIARMSAISSGLSNDFQQEMKDGRLGITAAYTLSSLSAEEQEKAFEDHKNRGGTAISEAKSIKEKKGRMESQTEGNLSLKSESKGVIMEQLSKIGFHEAHKKYKDIEMFHELCDYQDTGLTPEQVAELAMRSAEKNNCEYKIHIPSRDGYPDVIGRYYECSCGADYIDIKAAQEWNYCPYCGREVAGIESYSCESCKYAESDGESYYCENDNGEYSRENIDNANFDGCKYYTERLQE